MTPLGAKLLVVGSDVVSFATGVTAETRQDIANSALLAQLVAKKKVPDPARIYDWYQEYFDALAHWGWIIQARSFTEYSTASDEADVQRVILDIAETLLGSGAALAIIQVHIGYPQNRLPQQPLDNGFRS